MRSRALCWQREKEKIIFFLFIFPALHEQKLIKKADERFGEEKNMVILVWNSRSEKRVNICLFLFWLDNIWRACGKWSLPGSASVVHTSTHTAVHMRVFTQVGCVLSWQMRALHQYLNKVLWHPFLLRPCCFLRVCIACVVLVAKNLYVRE